MGREVRMVPADWEHPREINRHNGQMQYIPLFDGSDYAGRVLDWDEGCAKWERGEFPDYASEEDRALTYAEWEGERPKVEDYMPQWPDAECTHYMMYETCSEGTPISPAFATPEELARWLADTKASAFGNMTADYDHWLRVARGSSAPSMIIRGGMMESGVQAIPFEDH